MEYFLMAPLRKRRTADAKGSQERESEIQNTLGFDLNPESESTGSENQTVESEKSEAERESSEGEKPSQESESTEPARVVVKRRRIIKKSDEGEETGTDTATPAAAATSEAPATETAPNPAQPTQAPVSEEHQEHSSYKKPVQSPVNRQTKFTRKPNQTKRTYPVKSYPVPDAEMAENAVAATAAVQQEVNGFTEDNANKPRLVINEMTKKSMPELRTMAMQYGFTADDLAPM